MHLYLHIPFCRQACHYCDFHFSTQLDGRKALVDALSQELVLQQAYLSRQPLETIYLGGGTPSLLTEAELAQLMETVYRHFPVQANAEVTLEANPDDLTNEKLIQFKTLGVNRLSIGIQSFDEANLRHLHRIHTATEGESSVRRAQDVGIENISIDLIYAIGSAPDHRIWEHDLAKAISLGVPHISAYCLTIEPQTVFGNWLKRKKIQPIDDEFAAQQFELLTQHLSGAGYEQYEISNFAQAGRYSRHNTSYWQQEPYLGIGPSAHSFDGLTTRQYNVSNNARYVAAIERGEIPCETEHLTERNRVNEYLLISLRTQWGCNLSKLKAISQEGHALIHSFTPSLIESGWLFRDGDTLRLTTPGKLFADRVAAELFWV
ncbi:MAG: radical SAM family heme chaperone HemW [Cytophagaceae bacterium]|nr:radical SAM family heme chaperone HemW [Cytophagaceae bacterium]